MSNPWKRVWESNPATCNADKNAATVRSGVSPSRDSDPIVVADPSALTKPSVNMANRPPKAAGGGRPARPRQRSATGAACAKLAAGASPKVGAAGNFASAPDSKASTRFRGRKPARDKVERASAISCKVSSSTLSASPCARSRRIGSTTAGGAEESFPRKFRPFPDTKALYRMSQRTSDTAEARVGDVDGAKMEQEDSRSKKVKMVSPPWFPASPPSSNRNPSDAESGPLNGSIGRARALSSTNDRASKPNKSKGTKDNNPARANGTAASSKDCAGNRSALTKSVKPTLA
mmetsp:Transcript_75082/g.217085  ORF Transcript_75082/g.217085 Transcript_75082/m.217085 type:complete len:290 (-) Transcript_75082:2149-3018(-)